MIEKLLSLEARKLGSWKAIRLERPET